MPASAFPEHPSTFRPAKVWLQNSIPSSADRSPRRSRGINNGEYIAGSSIQIIDGRVVRYNAKESIGSVHSHLESSNRVIDIWRRSGVILGIQGKRRRGSGFERLRPLNPQAAYQTIATYVGKVEYIDENQVAGLTMQDEVSREEVEASTEAHRLADAGISAGDQFRMAVQSNGMFSTCVFEKVPRKAVTKEAIASAIRRAKESILD